jgi:CelD/BcsL family acetyltransferase involved in cellulose biosynthesis
VIRVSPRQLVVASEAPIAVREVTTASAFDELADGWRHVARRMELDSPFIDWEWARSWWETFAQPGDRLRILVFESGSGEVAGIAPFCERRHRAGPLTLASLAPIGWEDGGNQPVTEHIELLFPKPERAALFAALERWLRRRPWLVAWLPSLREDDELPPWLASHVVARCPAVPFHHRSLPATWDEFVAGLGKSMRDNVKYYPRLMVRHGHPFTFEVAVTPQELETAFPVLLDLHQRRSEMTTGVQHWNYFRLQARRDFVAGMLRVLGPAGEARIGVLRVRGEAVAAYLWLERGETMFLYRSGYAPEWSKYSPALVVVLEALRDGMRRGLNRVELLRGGGQLKERWDTDVRLERHAMLARAPRLARRLIAARAARRPTTYEVV